MSRVAESSTVICFFFENDGKGNELGAGETANADPAYTSVFPAIGVLKSTMRTLGIISGDRPIRTVPLTTKPSPPFFNDVAPAPLPVFIFESSDSPLLKMVTFSIKKSSELDLLTDFESSEADALLGIDGSD